MNQIDVLKDYGYKLAKAREILVKFGLFEKYSERSDEFVIEISFLLEALNYLKTYEEG